MPRSYCQLTDVERYLPLNIIVQGEYTVPTNPANPAPSSLTTGSLDWYIQNACDIIDGRLGTIYDVPLKQVNQGGDVGYPLLIVSVCALIAADYIYRQRLQGADREKSGSLKEDFEWAYAELDRIQNGEDRLSGQTIRGSRFIKGTLPSVPINPAQGNRTKGRGQ